MANSGAPPQTGPAAPSPASEDSAQQPSARRRSKARVTLTVLVVVLVVAGIVAGLMLTRHGGSSHQSTSTTPTPAAINKTEQIVFDPFTASGNLAAGVTIASRATGTCIGSLADGARSDAYRCFYPGGIGDPCFPYGDQYVLCFHSPTDLAATKVTPPTDQIVPQTSSPSADPWALVIADGQMCVFITGASQVVDGLRESYGCPGGSLYGDPNRSSPIWTIWYQAAGSNSLVQINVLKSYT